MPLPDEGTFHPIERNSSFRSGFIMGLLNFAKFKARAKKKAECIQHTRAFFLSELTPKLAKFNSSIMSNRPNIQLAHNQSGMTMIEIMLVVALIALIYSIAIPQFSLKSGTEVATKTQRLADDIRSAFDMAVLSNKTHRIVFELATGKYHLEVADGIVQLEEPISGHDPTEDEVKAKEEEFASQTKEYESMAGDPVKDEDGTPIEGSNMSPILRNRSRAAPTKWTQIDNLEWNNRSLGDFLLISEMQAEHHAEKQVMTELGPKGRAFLYFFPQGYVERAFIRVALKSDDMVIDDSQPPYTITTKSFLGNANVQSGVVEFNVKEADSGDDNE
ncbi:MAG: type II secretion system protein [Proteobacteria bacterium]|nr:type II secretion system protein [Pseudomonadota bacterium]